MTNILYRNGAVSVTTTDIESLSAKTVRMLAMDMVKCAGSGHYGFPLGATNIVHTLFSRHLRFDPKRPDWVNRDRFVLSAGHGSAMLYAMLHVAGYDISIDDLRAFRTLDSNTPGHPERGDTPGVEVTTGPLGQGVANAVGLAIAEESLRAHHGPEVIDHRTWVLASDGDLMEGVSHEAAALAGRLGLSRLTLIYDDNDVVIDGRASEVIDADGISDVFEALGWEVYGPVDGSNADALDQAFHASTLGDRPTFIRVRTKIGAGTPLEDDRTSHAGVPSDQELEATRRNLDLDDWQPFEVSTEVREFWAQRAQAHEDEPDHSAELSRRAGEAQEDLLASLQAVELPTEPESTRQTSGRFVAELAESPYMLGGSADLAEATFTELPNAGVFSAENRQGRNIRFGVREHAMGAIASGISMHSEMRAFASTFLMFATYEANAIRMSALQSSPAIFVFSHDSVLVGEDGPTHQPVEVLPFLRAIPNLRVWRPSDAAEVRDAWVGALEHSDGPSVIVLSRQAVPQLDRSRAEGALVDGALSVIRAVDDPEAVIVATGSEVHLAVAAAEALADRRVAVVSAPRLDTEAMLALETEAPPLLRDDGPPRLLVEASHPMSWWRLRRAGDQVVGVTTFGASAPAEAIAERFGLTSAAVTGALQQLLSG